MKCHYEILELERDATSEDIKKARDRLAKKYHPDKAFQMEDPASVAEFTAKFRLIQQAYEVLSDPHEKAWYDSHREQILSSGTRTKEDLDIYSFFNSSCYSGYGDDVEGFYSVYERLFERISEADIRIARDDKEDFDVPKFGNSTSSYEEVVNPFYGYWLSYCTKRKFFEEDKYDLRQADNRRMARAMEKENKKARDTAKKEFNESIRELAAFVRKRDSRIKAYRKVLEERAQEAQLKMQQNQEQQRLKRLELLKAGQATEHDAEMERQYRMLEKHLGSESEDEEEDQIEEEEDVVEEEDDPLFCIACEKGYSTFPQMRNHVKSKQHRKNVELLRSELTDSAEHSELLKKLNRMEMDDAEEDSPLVERKKAVNPVSNPEPPPMEPESKDDEEEETVVLAEADGKVEVEEYTSRSKAKKNKATKQVKQKEKDLGLRCGVCKALFPSRNKLFDHVKAEGHGLIKVVK